MALRIEREVIDAWRRVAAQPDAVKLRADFATKAFKLASAPSSETSWPLGVEAILTLLRALPSCDSFAWGAFSRAMSALIDGLDGFYARAAATTSAQCYPYTED